MKCDYDPVIIDRAPKRPLSKRQLDRLCKLKCGPITLNGIRTQVPELGRSESGAPFDLGFPVTGGARR